MTTATAPHIGAPAEGASRIILHGWSRHGDSHCHPLYSVWYAMNARCHNPARKDYERYGGRGIQVCEEWRRTDDRAVNGWRVTAFCEWAVLQGGWKPGLQLDRGDNHGDYSPSNCRFVTRAENMANRRAYRRKAA